MAPSSTPIAQPLEPPRFGLGRWFSRGAWAVIDQALISLASLLVLLLLGRWLDPADFGRFTIAYTVFLLLATAHTAMFVEAMLVFGPRKYAERVERYVGVVLVLQTPMVVAIAAAIGLVAVGCWIAGAVDLAEAFCAMAVATPLILLFWLARRPSYITLSPHRAAAGAAVYLLAVIVALQWLSYAHKLHAASAIAVMALASVAATFVLLRGCGIQWPADARDPLLRDVGAVHLDYARWAVPAAFLGLLPTQLCYLILPEFRGVESSAALRATSTLILPLIQLNIAAAGVLLPAMARYRGTRHGLHLLSAGAAVMFVGPLVGWVVLGALAEPLLRLFYGQTYADYGWLVWLLGIIPPLMGLSMLLNIILQTRGRQDAVFFASLGSAVCSATLGVALVWHDGLRGAAIGVIVSIMAAIVVAGAFVLTGSGGRVRSLGFGVQ